MYHTKASLTHTTHRSDRVHLWPRLATADSAQKVHLHSKYQEWLSGEGSKVRGTHLMTFATFPCLSLHTVIGSVSSSAVVPLSKVTKERKICASWPVTSAVSHDELK
jgi:hypothetical protein